MPIDALPHERDEDVLALYLLGLLPDDRMADCAERLAIDEDFLDLAGAMESELSLRYLEGSLPANQRAAFETFFLISPSRKTLLENLCAARYIASHARRGRMQLLLAVAATLALVGFGVGGYLYLQKRGGPTISSPPIVVSLPVPPTPTRQLATPPAADLVELAVAEIAQLRRLQPRYRGASRQDDVVAYVRPISTGRNLSDVSPIDGPIVSGQRVHLDAGLLSGIRNGNVYPVRYVNHDQDTPSSRGTVIILEANRSSSMARYTGERLEGPAQVLGQADARSRRFFNSLKRLSDPYTAKGLAEQALRYLPTSSIVAAEIRIEMLKLYRLSGDEDAARSELDAIREMRKGAAR